jgi:hypothetical protein
MNTSKKTTKSKTSAKKSSPEMKDLNAKSNPTGGRRGGQPKHPHDQAALARVNRENHPNQIQY